MGRPPPIDTGTGCDPPDQPSARMPLSWRTLSRGPSMLSRKSKRKSTGSPSPAKSPARSPAGGASTGRRSPSKDGPRTPSSNGNHQHVTLVGFRRQSTNSTTSDKYHEPQVPVAGLEFGIKRQQTASSQMFSSEQLPAIEPMSSQAGSDCAHDSLRAFPISEHQGIPAVPVPLSPPAPDDAPPRPPSSTHLGSVSAECGSALLGSIASEDHEHFRAAEDGEPAQAIGISNFFFPPDNYVRREPISTSSTPPTPLGDLGLDTFSVGESCEEPEVIRPTLVVSDREPNRR